MTPATGIESEVCADIAARQQRGIAKYGMTLADNPAETIERLQHIYEELLDAAVYCKWAMKRLNDPSSTTPSHSAAQPNRK